ncbi:AAA family ATPase [Geodermatophilus sp. DSM 45219]|uniref:AAA family ATPase n=1 Tax=Geodermatophilus sp. DSM 45219 TaxID=1881103 RepID=UPI0008871490|nr:AAA family ATPase [Geodermatophilus sp. DSM 45219]SDN46775.1 Predicted ATPase [Geodermatophilus sp. DSM 45219]
MRLEHVTLRHFRAFSEVGWELPSTGLILIAGANNTGKSALLSGLDVVTGTRVPEVARHAGSKDPAEVVARFALSDEDRAALLGRSAEGQRLIAQGALSWINLRFSESSDFTVTDIVGPLPDRDSVKTLAATTPDTLEAVPLGRGLRAPYDRSVRIGSSGIQIQGNEQLLSDYAPIFRGLKAWRARYYHFQALRPGTTRQRQLMSDPTLDPTGANLADVLLHLQTNRPSLFAAIQSLISEIVPEVGRLVTPTTGNLIEVAFEDPYVTDFRHNIKDVGSGVEQLLMTIVVGLTRSGPSTVVIEEPETNLNPAAQRALLGLLRDWSRNRLFVVATHSPVMIDWSGAPGNLLLVARRQGTSTLKPIHGDPAEVLSGLGVRLSDVLSADRILLCEGRSDEAILATWFPRLVRNPRVSVIPTGGGDNARHAETLGEWLAAADQADRRRVLFVRDRDELPHRLIERLQAAGAVYVLPRRELENYLLDTESIAAVLNASGDTSVTEDEVQTTLDDIVDDLRPEVIIKRVAWELQPVRLVDNRLRASMARERVTLSQMQDLVANRLPGSGDIRNRIHDLWTSAENDVNLRWPTERLQLVAGADVLDRLFMRLRGRHYKKDADGSAIARALGSAPPDLDRTVTEFMNEST